MSRHQHSLDRNLDDLLSRRPVSAPRDFAARTIQRMQQQQDADSRLDELLTSHPLEAPAGFASATLWRIRRRNVLAWATSIAASVAIALSVGSMMQRPALAPGNLVNSNPAVQVSEPQPAAGIAEVSHPEPSLAELLELADGLEGAEPLLDPDVVEAMDSDSPAINE